MLKKTTGIHSRSKLSLAQKLYYGSGALLSFSGSQMLIALTFPIYNIELGVDPALIGIAIMLSRIWDTVSDPIAGVLSDNTRTRFGRRRPFLFVGAILCFITLPIVFLVNDAWSENHKFVFFAITSLIFYTSFTIYSVPYWALGSELTPDYNERTKVIAIRTMIGFIGANVIVAWVYRLTQFELFGNALNGSYYVTLIIVGVLSTFGLLCAIKVREPYFKIAQKQKKVGVWESMRGVLTNGQALLAIGVYVISYMGNGLVQHLGIYINTYYITGGDTNMAASYVAIGGTIGGFLAFFSIQPLAKLSERIGKIRLMNLCLFLGIFASLLKFSFFNATYAWLQYFPVSMMMISSTGLAVMISSIKADIVDYDEVQSNLRREGAFGSAFGYINKGVSAFTALLAGMMLNFSGFNQALGADQAPGSILMIRVMFATIPAIFLLIAYLLLRKYTLTEDRMEMIRSELEARRGLV